MGQGNFMRQLSPETCSGQSAYYCTIHEGIVSAIISSSCHDVMRKELAKCPLCNDALALIAVTPSLSPLEVPFICCCNSHCPQFVFVPLHEHSESGMGTQAHPHAEDKHSPQAGFVNGSFT
jgi:hypothetical protein